MMKYVFVALLLAVSSLAHAQLTGIRNIPGDYPSLAAAITDLNVQGVGAGGVVIDLLAGNPQTAPAGGYTVTATGTAADPITLAGNGNVITAATPQAAGALNDALFKIIGADYVTIDGFVLQENVANTVMNPATNTMTEWGVALLKTSTVNGAQHNSILNNTISLVRLYENSFGVYSNTRHTAASVQSSINPISPAGANSYNRVYGNQVSDVNFGIAFISTLNAGAHDQFNDIGGISAATGNTLSNWGNGSALSVFTGNANGLYGIFMLQQENSNVSWNVLISAVASPVGAFRGILEDNTSSLDVSVNTISHNTITLSTTQSAFTFRMIDCTGGSGDCTVNINYNLIRNNSGGPNGGFIYYCIYCEGDPSVLNINYNTFEGNTHTAPTSIFACIFNSAASTDSTNIIGNQIGTAAAGAIVYSGPVMGSVYGIRNHNGGSGSVANISYNDFRSITHTGTTTSRHTYIENTASYPSTIIAHNTFTSMNCATSGDVTFISNNALHAAGTVHHVDFNRIVGGYTRSAGNGDVYLYYAAVNADTSVKEVNNGNNFSNINIPGTGMFHGWYSGSGDNLSGYGPEKAVCYNVFDSITLGSGDAIILDVTHADPHYAYNKVFYNTISNITSGGSLTCLNSGDGGANLKENVIHDVHAGGTLHGISVDQSDSGGLVSRNKVYNLSTTGNSVRGIRISYFSREVVVSNNYVGDLTAPYADTMNAVTGLWTYGPGPMYGSRFYYNTVYLNASSTGATFGTSGIYAHSGGYIELQNNLIINLSTPNGAGTTVAYRRFGPVFTPSYDSTSDHNAFYAGIPGPDHLIFSDGVTDLQNMTSYCAFVAPADAHSVTENTPFASVTGSSPQYLHIAPGTYSVLESAGHVLYALNYDFDLDVRPGPVGSIYGGGTAPDIGADEFDGQGFCNGVPTAGTANIPAPLCRGSSFVLSLTGPSTGVGITYQWMESATPGGPYTNIPGATGPAFTTTPQYIDQYYVAVVTCVLTGQADTSAEIPALVVGPVVTFQLALDTLCSSDNGVMLTGTPAGGIFSGNGVTGNLFNPSAAGTGFQILSYAVFDSATGCTVTAYDTMYVDYCTGADALATGSISVSPNPAPENITVNFGADLSNAQVIVLNALGQEVKQVTHSGTAVEVCTVDLAPGLYFLQVNSDGRTWTAAFVR